MTPVRPSAEEGTLELRRRLAAAGLHPSQDELAAMASIYGRLTPDVEALYTAPTVRYEQPALRFRAGDTGPRWPA
jgi:hypothetical protein